MATRRSSDLSPTATISTLFDIFFPTAYSGYNADQSTVGVLHLLVSTRHSSYARGFANLCFVASTGFDLNGFHHALFRARPPPADPPSSWSSWEVTVKRGPITMPRTRLARPSTDWIIMLTAMMPVNTAMVLRILTAAAADMVAERL